MNTGLWNMDSGLADAAPRNDSPLGSAALRGLRLGWVEAAIHVGEQ
jgi:hypothetical protein